MNTDASSMNATRVPADFIQQLRAALVRDLQALAPTGGSTRPKPFATLGQLVAKGVTAISQVHQQARDLRQQQAREKTQTLVTSATAATQSLQERVARRREDSSAKLDTGYVVAGRALDATSGQGLPRLRVQLLESVSQKEGVHSETVTDELGFFRITFSGDALKPLLERGPQLRVALLDSKGQKVFASEKPLQPKPGKVDWIDAAVEGARVPESREEGAQVEAEVQSDLAVLDQQITRAQHRLDSRLATPITATRPPTGVKPVIRGTSGPRGKPAGAAPTPTPTPLKAKSKRPTKKRGR